MSSSTKILICIVCQAFQRIGSVALMLIGVLPLLVVLLIICFMMEKAYGGFSVGFLAGSITLFVFGHFYLALASFLVSIYLGIETFRWVHWKEFYYNEVDGYAIKPPPENLILKLVRQKRKST